MEITEKELAVIREISNNHLPDQRTIATRTGQSLGLTNLIIKRLIIKGYIKAKQLNQKKIQYLLTPKGFSEKAKKSYSYALKTVNLVKMMRESLQHLVDEECKKGADYFEICGVGELSNIAELTFKNIGIEVVTYKRIEANPSDTHESLLIVYSSKNNTKKTINLLTFVSGQAYFGVE
ncbi:MAG: hypothetical protein ACYC5N_06790 [Endomicrobiales bacterium]